MDNSISVPKPSQGQVNVSNNGNSAGPTFLPARNQSSSNSSSIPSNSSASVIANTSVINSPGVHGDGSALSSASSSSALLLGLTSVICVSLAILATYYLYVRLRHGGGSGVGLRRGRKRPLKLDSCRYTHLEQTEPLDDDLSDLEGHSYGQVEADGRIASGMATTGGRKYAQQTEYKTATLVVDSTADENHTTPAPVPPTATMTSFGVGENYWLLNGVGVGGEAADEGALQSDEDLLQ